MIFISYRSSDLACVKQAYLELQMRSIPLWFDK